MIHHVSRLTFYQTNGEKVTMFAVEVIQRSSSVYICFIINECCVRCKIYQNLGAIAKFGILCSQNWSK